MADANCNPGVLLPDYILDRNRLALAAGLTIERQEIKRTGLTTWYSGTEAQWRSTPFCFREKPFTTKTYGRDEFHCFSPTRTGLLSVHLCSDTGHYRGTMPRETLPDRTEKLGNGITLYTMHVERGGRWPCKRSRCPVYIGDAQALIDWKIAPAEILRDQDQYFKCEKNQRFDYEEVEAAAVLA